MLSYSLMTLVDTILVGHLGRAQLAGVGLAGIAAFLLLCFSIGMFRAANTLVAQAMGGNRPDEVRATMGAVLVAAGGLGVLTLGAGQIVAELLHYFTATPAAGDAARTYMQIRILGAPLALLFAGLREVCYGRGDSRAPMMASIAANLVNIALAYLFVFVLGRGVAGAATATVIAHGAELGFLAFTRRAGGLRPAHLAPAAPEGAGAGRAAARGPVHARGRLVRAAVVHDLAPVRGRDGGAPDRAPGHPLLVHAGLRRRRGGGGAGGAGGRRRSRRPGAAHRAATPPWPRPSTPAPVRCC